MLKISKLTERLKPSLKDNYLEKNHLNTFFFAMKVFLIQINVFNFIKVVDVEF